MSEVENNEFNLNIPRYVDLSEDEPPIDISEVQAEIASLEEELDLVRNKMKHHLSELDYGS